MIPPASTGYFGTETRWVVSAVQQKSNGNHIWPFFIYYTNIYWMHATSLAFWLSEEMNSPVPAPLHHANHSTFPIRVTAADELCKLKYSTQLYHILRKTQISRGNWEMLRKVTAARLKGDSNCYLCPRHLVIAHPMTGHILLLLLLEMLKWPTYVLVHFPGAPLERNIWLT